MGLAQFLYIGNMNGSINCFDAAIWIAFSWADCFLYSASTFYDDGAFGRIDSKDSAFFAFVVASDDLDLVAFFDVCLDFSHGEICFEN